MLNPFPIQFLALLAYFLLRLFVGGALISFGIRHARTQKLLSKTFSRLAFAVPLLVVTELALGTMFVLGWYTQIAALLTMGMALTVITFRKYFTTELFESRTFYALLLGCAASLFITGAGVFAFDLPI